jgi:hypothetical protein
LKDKDIEKLKLTAKSYMARLGMYRQPFCWGLIPLFNEDHSLAIGENVEIRPFYKYKGTEIGDALFFDLLNEHSKGGSANSKRSKTLPGSCLVDVVELKEPLKTPAEPVISLDEFPPTPKLMPFQSIINDMYIYLDSVNLSTRANQNARNIAIKVQLFEADKPDAEPLPVFVGRNYSLSSSYLSGVTYHNKTPQFYDEIKVRLPLNLSARHHLLFTFYHVKCQLQKAGKSIQSGDIAVPVGYAVLPLFQQNK